MAPFALTIACSVLVSLFVSFSLDPMLSAYWPDPHKPCERSFISRGLGISATGSTGRPIGTARDRLGAATSLLDGGAGRSARSSAHWPCRRSGTGWRVLPGAGRLGVRDPFETPPGSNLAYTQKAEKSRRSRARYRAWRIHARGSAA
jgi:HAE1 family hydrophobic/amphiphilic exporter-1